MRKVMCGFTSVMAVVMLIGFSIGVVQAGPCELPVFVLADFDSSLDNTYFPQDVGYTYVYEADTEDELIRNYIYITPETVEIMGVICNVVYDVEWVWVEELNQWFKLEETDDWHAWDEYGNVWYFGEDTLEYIWNDDWTSYTTSDEGSWEAGVDDALPGIILPAAPTLGACVQQEYYEDEAEDMGKVLKLDASVSIDYGDYEDCLKTKEWTKLEPGNVEHKYYAPDVGLVYIEELKEKTVKVELVEKYFGIPPDPPPQP